MSSYSKNIYNKQSVLHEKNRRLSRFKKILGYTLFFVLVFGFFYFVNHPSFRVKSINIIGDTLVDKEEVKKFVQQKTSGRMLYLIPRDSIFFLKRKNLKNQILHEFPRLNKVLIDFGKNINVRIFESEYSNMYCSITTLPKSSVEKQEEIKDTETVKEESKEEEQEVVQQQNQPNKFNCFLLKNDGNLGSMAPVYSYPPFFTFYEVNDITPELGTNIVSLNELTRLHEIRDEIEQYNIKIIGFVYGDEYDEFLIDAGLPFEDLPRIRILQGAKVEDIKNTLGQIMKDKTVEKILLSDLNNLNYIDLRFDKQVVYKKKN